MSARSAPIRKLLITPGKRVKKQKITLSDRLKFMCTEQARLDAVIADYKVREKRTAIANYNREHALDFACMDKQSTHKSPSIDVSRYLAKLLHSTMLINTVINGKDRCNYRVFRDTLVTALTKDIARVCTISGMYADDKHTTRVILPDLALCQCLCDIFVPDSAGTVTIYISTIEKSM